MRRTPKFILQTVYHLLLAAIIGLAFCPPSFAATFKVFGNKTYVRGTNAPVAVTDRISIHNSNADYVLRVYNGGLTDTPTELVSSSFIYINGMQVIGPKNFNQNVYVLEVSLNGLLHTGDNNFISVELRGKPGGIATIYISGVDNELPELDLLSPGNGQLLSANPTAISAAMSDVTSGIDPASISLVVDGANVTSGAMVTESIITYVPTAKLSDGQHFVYASVADFASNASHANASFIVDTTPPNVAIQPSAGSTLDTDTPNVWVTYEDLTSGIDESSLVIKIDGEDKTASFTKTATTAGYQILPAQPLLSGTHTIDVTLRDKAGNLRTENSQFVVSVDDLRVVGRVDFSWGTPNDGAIQKIGGKTYLYLVLDESDTPLVYFDVTDPRHPIFKGSLPAPGWSLDVFVLDNYVFCPGTKGEVSILDASDPEHIGLIKMFNNGTSNRIKGIVVANLVNGNRVAMLDSNNGAFQVWNFNNLAAPTLIGQYPHPSQYGGGHIVLDHQQKHAYVANGTVDIYDVSDLAHPMRIASFSPSLEEGRFGKFAVSAADDRLYVPTKTGLSVYDISNPAAPIRVKEYEPNSGSVAGMLGNYNSLDLSADGTRILLGGGNYPQSLKFQEISANAALPAGYEVYEFIDQNRVKVAKYDTTIVNQKGGLQIIDIADGPNSIGSYIEPNQAIQFDWVKTDGNLAYVVDVFMGLRIIDIAEPVRPVQISAAHVSGEADDVVVMGSYAYVCQNLGGGIMIVDIADKRNPALINYYHTGCEHWGLAGHLDRYLYLSVNRNGQNWGLDVLDVSNPYNPIVVTRLPGPGFSDAFVEGGYLYTVGGQIYDLSDPAHPVLVGQINDNGVQMTGIGMEKLGPYVYYANSVYGKFQVVDVSNISKLGPRVVGTAITPIGGGWSQSVVIDPKRAFERAYISMGNAGIGVIDVSDPFAPQYINTISADVLGNALGEVTSMDIHGDYLYVNNYYGYMHEFDISLGVENLKLVKKIPNEGAYYVSRIVNGYAYRVRLTGMDIVRVPNSDKKDETPPPAVTGLAGAFSPASGLVFLWSNPDDADYVATKIVQSTTGFPMSILDGKLVYDGRQEGFVDLDLRSNTTYYYTAFAYDAWQNYSDAAASAQVEVYVEDPVPPASVTCFSAVGGDGQVELSWKNPSDNDFMGTVILRREDRFPISISEEATRVIYAGSAVSIVDTDIVNGVKYYYTAVAYDTTLNYSTVTETSCDFGVAATVLFSDDFESGSLGALPSKWLIKNSANAESARVYDDSLHPSLSWAQTSFALGSKAMGGRTSGGEGVASGASWGWWINSPAAASFSTPTIYAKIMDPDDPGNLSQNTENFVIYFGYVDNANFSKITFYTHYQSRAAVTQVIGGAAVQYDAPMSLISGLDGNWHQVRVKVTPVGPEVYSGGELVFRIENNLVYRRYDNKYYTNTLAWSYKHVAGLVGVGGSGGVYVDDVSVTQE